MKGQIINLEWIPGFNINSSRGYNKRDIKKAMETADYVENRGFGNYRVIKYSKYIAQIIYEDGTECTMDIRENIKDFFNIPRITKSVRQSIEELLPIDVELNENGLMLKNYNN